VHIGGGAAGQLDDAPARDAVHRLHVGPAAHVEPRIVVCGGFSRLIDAHDARHLAVQPDARHVARRNAGLVHQRPDGLGAGKIHLQRLLPDHAGPGGDQPRRLKSGCDQGDVLVKQRGLGPLGADVHSDQIRAHGPLLRRPRPTADSRFTVRSLPSQIPLPAGGAGGAHRRRRSASGASRGCPSPGGHRRSGSARRCGSRSRDTARTFRSPP